MYTYLFNDLDIFNNIADKFWNVGRTAVKQFYPISRFWAFTFPVVNINHPDDVEVF